VEKEHAEERRRKNGDDERHGGQSEKSVHLTGQEAGAVLLKRFGKRGAIAGHRLPPAGNARRRQPLE
jgi:hypothetical protein